MPVVMLLIILLLPLAWICWKLFTGLRSMEIRMGVGVVLSRYDNPILFWTVFALQCAFASLLVGTFGFIVFVLPHLTMT
jgi:ABC-type Fe3+-siderophore transport system permease subunit